METIDRVISNEEPDVITITTFNGRIETRFNGELHSCEGRPAVVHPGGTKEWYNGGQRYVPSDEECDCSDREISECLNEVGDAAKETALPDETVVIKSYGVESIQVKGQWHTYEVCESRLNGKLHSFDDRPAIVHRGISVWHCHGQIHRDGDLPAVTTLSGTNKYYKCGKLHRDGDLPAVEHADGSKQWYFEGQNHRNGDLPAAVYANGTVEYAKFGKLHRDYGLPVAIYPKGPTEYYVQGQLHRDGDLPAIEHRDGTKKWYKCGVEYIPADAASR